MRSRASLAIARPYSKDITAYVDSTMGKNRLTTNLIRKGRERAPQLIGEITDKASGFFFG